MRDFLSSLILFGVFVLAMNPATVVQMREDIFQSPVMIFDLPDVFLPDAADDLPRIADVRKIRRGDPWIGETPCSVQMFTPPDTLPGLGPREDGPVLQSPISTVVAPIRVGSTTSLYRHESGLTLRLVTPQIESYTVRGRSFREARTDLQNRRPLDARKLPGLDGPPALPDQDDRVTVAHILSPTLMHYRYSRIGPNWRGGNYHLLTDQTMVTSAYVVTLPQWSGYAQASAADRRRWDDLYCSAAHHELGHMRIRLDLLAETLGGFATLQAPSAAELTQAIDVARTAIDARIAMRQDSYHIHNGGGTRRGMIELPYAELPFPWLSGADADPEES